jgi:D-alanine-D-alanine ligase
MGKPVIAFVTGGYSAEAEISYKSAITIERNLDTDIFTIYKIDIRPDKWVYVDGQGTEFLVDKGDFSLQIESQRITFDAAFIGIHGTPGEDGKLQGYFDLLNIPYTSCDTTTSAVTFNKRYTVAVTGASGFNVARSIHLFIQSYQPGSIVNSGLTFPVFVKPNNGGSSIGMSKVAVAEDLEKAIQKAFEQDTQVLIEEFIAGREFTIGVFKTKGKIVTLPFTEILTENDFFDFEAKYKGKSNEVTPAICSDQIRESINEAAAGIYAVFNCRGVVRMDFIYDEAKSKPYLIEINTVPGQSAASIVPQQVAAAGLSLKEFYTMLVMEALEQN